MYNNVLMWTIIIIVVHITSSIVAKQNNDALVAWCDKRKFRRNIMQENDQSKFLGGIGRAEH